MQTWEYTILCWHEDRRRWTCPSLVGVEVDPSEEDWEVANRLGSDGWELAAVERDGGVWFKRPKGSGDGAGND